MKKILIVEDEQDIAFLLKYNLEKGGYLCEISGSGESALDLLTRNSFDLIILDVLLPKLNGFEVCKKIKKDRERTNIPIIMITAKGEETDRIYGLELGVEDYIVKPFSPREVVLRINNILKRTNIESSKVYKIGALIIDPSKYVVLKNKINVQLTRMEFKLLLVLVQRKGNVQTREMLLNDVWEENSNITTRTIDTHVGRLRQKLSLDNKSLETIHGVGYKMNEII